MRMFEEGLWQEVERRLRRETIHEYLDRQADISRILTALVWFPRSYQASTMNMITGTSHPGYNGSSYRTHDISPGKEKCFSASSLIKSIFRSLPPDVTSVFFRCADKQNKIENLCNQS